jgi:hypothetical protein
MRWLLIPGTCVIFDVIFPPVTLSTIDRVKFFSFNKFPIIVYKGIFSKANISSLKSELPTENDLSSPRYTFK